MIKSYRELYFDILKNYDEYIKMLNTYKNSSSIRINYLIEKFGGYNYEDECYYNIFKKSDGSYYSMDIYCNKFDSTCLIIYSSKGSNELNNILKENNIIGFNMSEDEDTLFMKLNFPKDENKLYYITDKLINIFNSI